VLARAHGFESWPKLKEHVDRVTIDRLIDAVRAGDVPGVRAMLRQRPELVHVDRAGNDEHKALHYAVLRRDVEMVRVLMAAGANPNQGIYPHRDATGALTLARERGYADVVAAIEAEERHRRAAMSCPNATVSPVQDRLNDAIRGGNADAAIAILEGDPSLARACDRDGGTPLHVAAAALDEQLVGWLLDHGGDVKRRDLHGQTPLDRAVRVVEWRRKGSLAKFPAVAHRLRHRGAELTPPAAVATGDAAHVRQRFDEDKSSIADPRHGLLTVAVNHERPDMLRFLLDLGLDPDERKRLSEFDEPAYTQGEPLWRCAAAGQYEMAAVLLDRGADPNATVHASGTPVSQAYGARDERMKALLAARGGRPDAPMVGLYRDVAAARAMLDRDPPPPEVIARERHAGETVAEQMLWGAACGGDPEIVRLCLARVDWPRDDPRWFTILEQPLRIWNHGPGHWVDPATDRSTYPVCFKLILDRCDPNVVGRFGARMLHRVAALGNTWNVKVMTEPERVTFATMLLDAGADVRVRDELLKSTPLGWAARWGRRELVELLLSRGAPANEADAEPWATPLSWAEKRGHAEIAQSLRAAGAMS
jgi:ankyrin repeat protein